MEVRYQRYHDAIERLRDRDTQLMSEIRHLSRAPIEEAVVEILVTPREGHAVSELEALCDRVAETYPKKLYNRQFTAQMKFSKDPTAETLKQWLHGFRLETEERAKVVQFNADKFSFSWLRPYDTWESFVGEARKNWELYGEVWKPTSVCRVGTRFVNRLTLPTKDLDFDHYFTAFPRIPPNLPQSLVTFLSRVVVPVDEEKTALSISVALEEALCTAESLSVILDIDVFREAQNFDPKVQIWDLIESFRGLKNQAFFGSLTEKAVEAFI